MRARLVIVVGILLMLVPAAATAAGLGAQAAPRPVSAQAAAQILTWTANDSVTAYATVTTTAAAGAATIVFENSEATGNTTGMQHTLTFDTIAAGYNHDVNLNLMAYPSDANGGLATAEVVLTPGTYLFKCVIPGHGTMFGELVVTGGGGGEDTTAPTVTAMLHGEQDPDGAYVDTAEVMLAATDEAGGSGVAGVEYDLDAAGYTPYGDPFAVTEAGEHTVDYRATDNAGNVSAVGTETFTVVDDGGGVPDTTAPTVTAMVHGEQDDAGAYVGSAEVMLSAADEAGGSGVAGIESDLDGAGYTAYTDPFAVAAAGEHTLSFRATDVAGNVSEVGTETFTVVAGAPDTTAPTVTATLSGDQDEAGAYVGSAEVALAAADEAGGSGVASIEHDLDGAGFVAHTDPLVVSDVGEHVVAYRATDVAGNVSAVGSTTFAVVAGQVDTDAPEVAAAVAGNQDGGWQYVGPATVTLTATDDGSGVASTEVAVDDDDFGAYTGPVRVEETGAHTVRFRATDVAGNVSPVGSASFTIAEDAGPVTCTSPDPGATVVMGDAGSGVRNRVADDATCTIDDLIHDERSWASHARFVTHAKAVLAGLLEDGVVTGAERNAIVSAAQRSDVGR